ncbi:MAG: hypothetical protein D6712_08790, partial [Chloroflexi bacterium]
IGTAIADDIDLDTVITVTGNGGSPTILTLTPTDIDAISVDGGAGDDTYIVAASAAANFTISDSSGTNDDLRIEGTAGADTFDVSASQVQVGATSITAPAGVEIITLDGLAGNDTYNIDYNGLSLNFDIADSSGAGDALVLTGTAGADTFTINSSQVSGTETFNIGGIDDVTVNAGAGADNINVAFNGFSSVDLNGEADSDTIVLDTTGATGGDITIDGGTEVDDITLTLDLSNGTYTTLNINGGSASAEDALTVNLSTASENITYLNSAPTTITIEDTNSANTQNIALDSAFSDITFDGNDGVDTYTLEPVTGVTVNVVQTSGTVDQDIINIDGRGLTISTPSASLKDQLDFGVGGADGVITFSDADLLRVTVNNFDYNIVAADFAELTNSLQTLADWFTMLEDFGLLGEQIPGAVDSSGTDLDPITAGGDLDLGGIFQQLHDDIVALGAATTLSAIVGLLAAGATAGPVSMVFNNAEALLEIDPAVQADVAFEGDVEITLATQSFDFDLGAEASVLKIEFGAGAQGAVDVDGVLRTDNTANGYGFRFGFGLSAANSFFIDPSDWDGQLNLNGTINATLNIGVIEVSTTGATVNIVAAFDMSLPGLTVGQLSSNTTTGITFAVDTDAGDGDPASSVSFNIPLNFSAPQSAMLDAAMQAFLSGQSINVTLNASDVFGGTPSLSVGTFIDFAGYGPEDVLNIMRNLGSWFDQLSFAGFLDLPVPFLSGETLGDVFDFGRAFAEDVLDYIMILNDHECPDSDLSKPDDGQEVGVCENGNPRFRNLQQLSTYLTDVIGTTVTLFYDSSAKELTFTLDWLINFGKYRLSPILPPGSNLQVDNVADPSADAANLNLSSDLTFDIRVDGTKYSITITQAEGNQSSLDALVALIQGKVDAALAGISGYNAGDVEVYARRVLDATNTPINSGETWEIAFRSYFTNGLNFDFNVEIPDVASLTLTNSQLGLT